MTLFESIFSMHHETYIYDIEQSKRHIRITYICIMYIYTYRKRARERQRKRSGERQREEQRTLTM